MYRCDTVGSAASGLEPSRVISHILHQLSAHHATSITCSEEIYIEHLSFLDGVCSPRVTGAPSRVSSGLEALPLATLSKVGTAACSPTFASVIKPQNVSTLRIFHVWSFHEGCLLCCVTLSRWDILHLRPSISERMATRASPVDPLHCLFFPRR